MSLLETLSKDVLKRFGGIDKQRVVNNALQLVDDLKNKESDKYKSPAVGGRWDKPYNRKYAKRKGVSPNAVDLRSRGSRSIERTKVTANKDGTGSIKFRDKKKGIIFGYHQTGTAKGGKTRQIYPERPKQVPPEVTQEVIDTITAEILRQS